MQRAEQGPDRTLDGAHHDAREGPERAPDGLGQERLARIGEAADTDQSRRAAVDGGDIVLHLAQLRQDALGAESAQDAGRCGHHALRGAREEFYPQVRLQMTDRSEEHTSELQSLMRISYAVFCLKTKTQINNLN